MARDVAKLSILLITISLISIASQAQNGQRDISAFHLGGSISGSLRALCLQPRDAVAQVRHFRVQSRQLVLHRFPRNFLQFVHQLLHLFGLKLRQSIERLTEDFAQKLFKILSHIVEVGSN